MYFIIRSSQLERNKISNIKETKMYHELRNLLV